MLVERIEVCKPQFRVNEVLKQPEPVARIPEPTYSPLTLHQVPLGLKGLSYKMLHFKGLISKMLHTYFQGMIQQQ